MIVAGVGCRRGAPAPDIETAIRTALQSAGIAADALDAIATAQAKGAEAGIAVAAEKLGVRVVLVPEAELKTASARTTTRSERVLALTGVPSVAEAAGPHAVGVILTGMGSDGAKGSQSVKACGGHVIAQDEVTSVIFGMPAEAIKTGAVDQVLGIDAIVPAVEKRVLYLMGAARVGAM